MITVVFENGAVSKLNNVYKMTVDEEDLDKIFVNPNHSFAFIFSKPKNIKKEH